MATIRIQVRRGAASQWTSVNPTLEAGEIGLETDTNKIKFGTGSTVWTALSYLSVGDIPEIAMDAINTAITLGSGLTKSYNDDGNTISISLDTAVVATLSGTQTLTNKTLTSPVINTPTGITKSDVGLANVDNTSDANKPVSTAAQTALDLKATNAALASHEADTTTIHGIADTALLATMNYVDTAVGALSSSVDTDFIPVGDRGGINGVAPLNASVKIDNSYLTSDVVLKNETQTLTNKTITSPVINTPTGITKSDVGLANVDNTSDANKPVSTATQTALDLKAPVLSPAFSGIPTANTAIPGTNNTQIATTAYADAAVAAIIDTAPAALNTLNEIAAAIGDDANFAGTIVGLVSDLEADFLGHSGSPSAHGSQGDLVGLQNTQTLTNKSISGTTNTLSNIPQSAITNLSTALALYATAANPTFTGTATGLTKASVDLANVDNTSDANKPVSTLTQTALDLKASIINLDLKAPIASPQFTGTVVLPGTTSIGTTTSSEIAKLHDITATAAELNILDGVTATTAELNVLDGIMASTSELNILDGVTASFSEINVLDGIISTTAELNILNGVTATAAELNILDGVSASAAEINHLSGVTSAIQTQLNAKANSADITEAAQDAVGDVIGYGLVYDDTTGKIQPNLETAGGLKFAPTTNKLAADLDYVVDKTSVQTLTNKTFTSPKINEDVSVTATATELNVLDGITSSTAELNILDGVLTSASELNILDGAGLTTIELNYLMGSTSSIQTQLNAKQAIVANVSDTEIGYLDGVTSAIQTQLNGKQATVANVSDVEIGYLDGVTSAIQTQLDAKLAASTASSTYQPIVSGVSDTEIGYLDGVTSAIQTQINDKLATATASSTYAPLASPTFTGTVSGVTKTHVGLSNVDNTADASKPVSTATQTALDLKLASATAATTYAPLASPTFTGTVTLPGAPTSDLHAATKLYVDNISAGLNFHQPVRVATTGNITLSGTQTIDGVAVIAGDRVLVKDQTTQTQNGLYVVAEGAWSRALDADNTPDAELKGGDFTLVLEGTIGSGYGYVCSNTSAITIGTTNVTYATFNAAKAVVAGNGLSEATPGTLSIDTAVTQARVANVSDTEIGYLDGVTSAIQTQLDTKETRYYTFVTDATTARTVTASTDEGKTLRFTSSSPITVTIPTAANDAGWAVGDYVEIIQYGSGQITVAGDTGVTVNATDSQKKTRVQFSSLTLIKVTANEWLLTGDTTA